MLEPEPLEAISARKLVLETAKFNVITAYSLKAAEVLLRQFPAVSGVILHSDYECERPVRAVKKLNSRMAVIVLARHVGFRCKGADYRISSHDPDALLQLLRRVFGDPLKLTRA